MNTALRTNESVPSGVHRILLEQLEDVRKALESQPPSDESVHAIRKELKRARANLRLLREALGITRYRRLNRAVRDAARPLTPLRDATILLQAIDKLVEDADDASGVFICDELRGSLREELLVNRRQLKASDIAAIRERLHTVKQSLRNLSRDRLDQADVDTALKRAYRKARNAFKVAEQEPSDENFHEWRKQVKYELNQLELFESLKPKRIGTILRQAHKLSDHLGDDHDLALLHDRITVQLEQAQTAHEVTNSEALLKALKSKRSKLQGKAQRLGKSLYAEKAGRTATKSPSLKK